MRKQDMEAQISVPVPLEFFEKIDQLRLTIEQGKILTRTEAIRRILKKGMSQFNT
jgi:hypothetical protein